MLEPGAFIVIIIGLVIVAVIAAKWRTAEPNIQDHQHLFELSLPYDENVFAVMKSLFEREGIRYREMPFSHPDPYRWLSPTKAYVLLVAEADRERAERIVNELSSSD